MKHKMKLGSAEDTGMSPGYLPPELWAGQGRYVWQASLRRKYSGDRTLEQMRCIYSMGMSVITPSAPL